MHWRLLILKRDVSTVLTGNVGAIMVDTSAEVLWKHALYINDMKKLLYFKKLNSSTFKHFAILRLEKNP